MQNFRRARLDGPDPFTEEDSELIRDELTYTTMCELAELQDLGTFISQADSSSLALRKDNQMKKQTPTPNDPTPISETQDLGQHTRAVAEAVTASEALSVDDPVLSDTLAHARASVEAVRVAAMHIVFPTDFRPVSQATLDDFRFAIDCAGVLPFESMVPVLARLHADAIDQHPELATLVRGARGQALIRLHARRAANPEPEATAKAEGTAVAAFVAAVSTQLQTRGLLVPASAVLSEYVPAWTSRLETVARRHDEHQVAQAQAAKTAEARERAALVATARAKEQQQRAAQLNSEDREMRNRRESLADFYRRHAGFKFPINGAMRTAEECAADLLEGAEVQPYYAAQWNGTPVRRTVV